LEGGTPIEFQGGQPSIEITPSLESPRVLTLGIRAAFLASRCPSTTIHQPPIAIQSNFHNCLKIITKFHRHLHYRISSFDLPVNYNRF
ncbi:hypothetical protein B296_00032262, partial [Ensete ventricosum]